MFAAILTHPIIPTGAPSLLADAHAGTGRKPGGSVWERARLSVVALFGAIVAIAILSIVFAVFTSARHADVVAHAHERDLFANAIAAHAEQVLREVESVASTTEAARAISLERDIDVIGNRLADDFQHDFVFVVDKSDNLIYSLYGSDRTYQDWFQKVRFDLDPVIDILRQRNSLDARALTHDHSTRAALVHTFLGHPAVIAGTLASPPAQAQLPSARSDSTRGRRTPGATDEDRAAPIVLSVKFIGDDTLSDIATRLDLPNLRYVGVEPVPASDSVFILGTDRGRKNANIAWTPHRPGAEIAYNVVPFVALALAGFALLAALVLAYMRRTAATIAAGETRLRHLALHDPLCGLPNRNYFFERLEGLIQEVRDGAARAAVLYIDLDHFKDVNDTLGHPVGDELIRDVTNRLSRALGGDDLVARFGGDEFAVLAPSAADNATVQAIAARILSALCAPYSINGHTIVIGASIGIALIDQRVGGAPDIMRYADMALYRAKNEGRNRACIYDNAMDADLTDRKKLENDLRAAIEDDRLHLVYQPVVNASGEIMMGAEALARWNHPERENVPPTEFIPIAEHSGLIIALGEWVLRQACRDGKSWPNLTVAVNVSPLQFRRADFVDVVERILSETGFPADRLELEITESTLIGNVDAAETAMLRLKALGVRLALDDFGTGYSSLLYLRRFPFDKLKIDNSFVRSIEIAADAAAIVHAIVGLGRGLGMKVTAEGVETAEQQLFLRAAGVHSMQGFRFGKPMPAAKITQRLEASTGHGLSRDRFGARAH
jgi:diguanylate cyclase (GGDEF)-like protein